MNPITDLLKCEHPIILGAMGVICNPELVAAVSEAGGFGLLATAFASSVEVFQKQVQETKALTKKPFGANLQVMNPLVPEFINILADEGIPAVTVSGGSPKTIIPLLKEKGIKVIPVVPSVDVARKSEALGVDAIVAEGSESGGMQGFKGASTMVLVPAVADAVNVPVIAAGGIADSRGYKAAMALGASGVQVGTRFIATKECIAHENYKNAVVNTSESSTCLLNLGAFQIRALQTALTDKILSDPSQMGNSFSGKGIEASWIKGDMDAGVLPVGEVSGVIHTILSVKEIINEMIK
jgi:enoyl-[acyl-carrier protein] reductase II